MLALIIFQRMLSKTAWDSVAAQNLHSLNGEFFFPQPGIWSVLSFSSPGASAAVPSLCTQVILLNNCPV